MLNKKARSFVTIMIVFALSVLLLRMGINRLIKFNIAQNQISCSKNLKILVDALEAFASDNKGVYPKELAQLTQGSHVYLKKDYIMSSPLKGYEYDCPRMDQTGYNCLAVPSRCKLTGEAAYSVSTGGLIVSEACDKE